VDGLKYTIAAIPGGNTRRTYGVAYWDGAAWFANIGGNLLTCRWLTAVRPVQGGGIVVDISTDERGQSSALVVGGYLDQPAPATGTVLTVGVAEIVFTGEDGGSYATDRFVGSYSPGDAIFLAWTGGPPAILGKIASVTTVPRAEEPQTQPVAATGELSIPATASDTFGVGGWGRWATSQRGGEDVYSGDWGGYTVTGSWFYGAAAQSLQGKTITRIRFKVPARMNAGASGSATVHFYAHDSPSRPGGDVSRVVGPMDAPIAAGFGGDYIDLPLSFASALVAGGGVSIAGNPYVGFNSRLDDPESGKLLIDWSA
jgi:hypothetical protein